MHVSGNFDPVEAEQFKAVVSIHVSFPRSFDTCAAGDFCGTGFVVDRVNGYILTNLHIVGSGPFIGRATFHTRQECNVYVAYRDPVHDFAFLRFDPDDLSHTDLAQIALDPDGARVGQEFLVVGNNGGQILSLVRGQVAIVDRNPPVYGQGKYNDTNTTYIQSTTLAKGGSSGSPVLARDGNAIAMAGGKGEAFTNFFVKLHYPMEVLQNLQDNVVTQRGTVQASWTLRSFDECRRLGLASAHEKELRESNASAISALVVKSILPGGPAYDKLKEGDVILRLNHELISHPLPLEIQLDRHVNGSVEFTLSRWGHVINVSVDVQDLHSITPTRFLAVGQDTFSCMSYHMAHSFNLGLGESGVYWSQTEALVTSIDSKPTLTLEDLITVLLELPDQSIFNFGLMDPATSKISTMSRQLLLGDKQEMILCTWNQSTSRFDASPVGTVRPPCVGIAKPFSFPKARALDDTARKAFTSFVEVRIVIPVGHQGFRSDTHTTMGLVIDADLGLLVVSHAFVPTKFVHVGLCIASSVVIQGTVRYLHPDGNFVLIQYEPTALHEPLRAIELCDRQLGEGDEVQFLGFDRRHDPFATTTTINQKNASVFPALSTPTYTVLFAEILTVANSQASRCSTGVLLDGKTGTVRALWLSHSCATDGGAQSTTYNLGRHCTPIIDALRLLRDGASLETFVLPSSWRSRSIQKARTYGVDEDWITRMEQEQPERPEFLSVHHTYAKFDSGLRAGDILLSLNGKLVGSANDVNAVFGKCNVDAEIVRKGKTMTTMLSRMSSDQAMTDRILVLCGAVIHRPHLAVYQQATTVPSQLYISSILQGSPASKADLLVGSFITAIEGEPVATLDELLAFVRGISGEGFTLTTSSLSGNVTLKPMCTIGQDFWFKTTELVEATPGTGEWRYKSHSTRNDGVPPVGGFFWPSHFE